MSSCYRLQGWGNTQAKGGCGFWAQELLCDPWASRLTFVLHEMKVPSGSPPQRCFGHLKLELDVPAKKMLLDFFLNGFLLSVYFHSLMVTLPRARTQS